jgi:hypothetical protein
MDDSMDDSMRHDKDFLTEEEIERTFLPKTFFKDSSPENIPTIQDWFKKEDDVRTVPHHKDIGDGFNCNHLVDKWLEWALTLSAKVNPIAMSGAGYAPGILSAENAVFFRSEGGKASAYFCAASPFHSPDNVRVVITEQVPVLTPVYFIETSKEENNKLDDNGRINMIKNDLAGIYELHATLDRKPIYGCCVFRDKPLEIPNIPKDNLFGIPADRLLDSDNKIHLMHGGVWLLINPNSLSSGDHLLHYTAKSNNYEIEAKILISALY